MTTTDVVIQETYQISVSLRTSAHTGVAIRSPKCYVLSKAIDKIGFLRGNGLPRRRFLNGDVAMTLKFDGFPVSIAYRTMQPIGREYIVKLPG